MTEQQLDAIRGRDGKLSAYAWPGGYPLSYVLNDGEVLCPNCVNDATNPVHVGGRADGWRIEGYEINYEDPALYCAHCNARIESAYAEGDDETQDRPNGYPSGTIGSETR